MEQWLKIAENLAHKRAGVILAAIGVMAFTDQDLATNIIIGAVSVVYTIFQTMGDKKGENGK